MQVDIKVGKENNALWNTKLLQHT